MFFVFGASYLHLATICAVKILGFNVEIELHRAILQEIIQASLWSFPFIDQLLVCECECLSNLLCDGPVIDQSPVQVLPQLHVQRISLVRYRKWKGWKLLKLVLLYFQTGYLSFLFPFALCIQVCNWRGVKQWELHDAVLCSRYAFNVWWEVAVGKWWEAKTRFPLDPGCVKAAPLPT